MIDEAYRPHITLGACEDLSLDKCSGSVESFAAATEPFTVEMPYLGLFPNENGAVFLGVTVTETLLAYQKSFHEMFGKHSSTLFDIFAPGKWVPHCTLAYHESAEKDLKALQVSRGLSLPIIATCERLAVIEFPPWRERLVAPLGKQGKG